MLPELVTLLGVKFLAEALLPDKALLLMMCGCRRRHLNLPELVMLSGVKSVPEMLVMVVLSEAVLLLKQGLHSGMSSELMLMWERPSVQWIVEEGRRGSRRMRRRQGRRNKVESSIVLLSNFLKPFS